jgi:hypothetical protein
MLFNGYYETKLVNAPRVLVLYKTFLEVIIYDLLG